MTFLNTILDMVFPAYCMSCGEKGSDFCIKCLSTSPVAERESAKWIFPLFDYRHPPIKKSLWLFKYKGKKRFAKIFAEYLYDKILEELSDLSVLQNFYKPILIPIPLSRKRRRERGYNQVRLICKELIKINNARNGADLGLEENILIKINDNEHQARIHNRSERLKNMIGSFAIKNPELIKNRNVILIDDITTTGATLAEARKMLKQAYARKVIAFTVAH